MFDRILQRARALVRASNYYMTSHAQFAMYEDELTLVEIEQGILNGRILERQRDSKSGEFKYRLRGATPGDEIEIIFKFAPAGRLAIITVYCL